MSWGIELHSGSLPIFAGEEWEDCLSAWANLEQHEGMVQLAKGAVLAKLETKYGEGSLEKFAQEIGITYAAALDYAWVYRRLERIRISERSEILEALTSGNLYYSHVRKAVSIKEDAAFVSLLIKAQEDNWRVRRVAEEVHAHKAGLPSPSEEKLKEVEEASAEGAGVLVGLSVPERERLAEKGLEQERAELRVVEADEVVEAEIVDDRPTLPMRPSGELSPEQRAYFDLFPVLKDLLDLEPEQVAAAAPDAEGAQLAKEVFKEVLPWMDRFFGSLTGIRLVK